MNYRIKIRTARYIAVFILFNMVVQWLSPLTAYALTSGATAPEVASFEPANTTDMVDIFTGDFNYNIPLFELPGPNGGYPFNIAYHAGGGMDEEATWTGLGWNINAGAINRNLRGIPDDFNGDLITTRNNLKTNFTVGVKSGVGIEVFGADADKGLGLSMSSSIYYNSYRGVGFSTGVGVSAEFNKATSVNSNSGLGLGLGLSLSFDSQEGVGVNPSITLSSTSNSHDRNQTSLSLGIGYNSKRGLGEMSITASSKKVGKQLAKYVEKKMKEQLQVKDLPSDLKALISDLKENDVDPQQRVGSSASISFANDGFLPSIENEMVGSNLSITLKAGSELWGCDVNGFLSGFYSEQHLKYQNVNVNHKAYGYLNMQNDVEQAWMTDFNREKDGVIRKETPVAGSPALNSDVYNIQGQGVGGMFRPFRSDVGTVYDSKALSYSVGGAGGFDFGAGSLAKLGGDGSFNGSVSLSGGLWGGNQNSIKFRAKSNVSNQEDYEPYYYKVNGEYTSEPIEYYGIWGNDDAVRINITGIDSYSPDLVRYDVKSGTVLQTVKGSLANNYRHAVNTQHGFQSSRKPRNSSVQSFTNDELSKIDAVSNECLSEHLAFFYAAINADAFSCQTKPIDDLQKISRGNYKNQMGSYVTLDPNGTRYIYGLPVYNLKNVEDTRSVFPEYSDNTPITSGENSVVDGKFQYPSSTSPTSGIDDPNHISNEFIAHKEMPPYITSNLLTAVLGADYIDVDNNGPSENDFGYWVKFNYVKTSDASNPYKWRAPYIKGNFMQGTRALHGDDKAGYMYGEKEVYYLASAETKTHIAIFEISKRHDAKGVINEIQNSVSFIGAQSSYKLDAIKLYTKAEYYNFSTSGVKSINSTAKPISVVHLDYTYDLCKGVLNNDGAGEGNAGGKLTLKKLYFTYERSSRGALTPYIFDYKETDADYNPDYNNMNQDRWGNYKNYGSSPTTEDYMLNYTPQFSGSTTTPFQISDEKRKKNAAAWCLQSIKTPTGSDINIEYEPDDYGYVQHRTADQMFKIEGFGTLSSNQLYSNASGAWTNSNDNRSVFFKLKTPTNSIVELNKYIEDLKTPTGKKQIYFKTLINMKSDQFSDLQEYVSGYLDYESIEWGDAPSGGGLHQYGKIVLSKAKIGEKEVDFAHPISLAAWQFLHINMPELATCPGAPAEGSANPERAVKQLASIGKEIQNMFSGFNRNCKKNRWAQYADINHSIIRLNCPDKKKIGGDLRVKSIIIKDNSNYDSDDGEKEYGVVYDYTTIENGVQISSGVAAYEPIMGGDEISLRYAKDYPERIPLKTNNNLFFEYPVNESYYPGASVGYSRVTIKSLATYRQLEYLSGNAAYSKYQNILGTGETVQEYYTAKDFPVIADITEFLKINNRGFVPLPFLGQISFDNLTGSQGFSVKLNDMHGKLKQISYYGQDKNGKLLSIPVSSTSYQYLSHERLYEGKHVLELDNNVQTLTADGKSELRTMGKDIEMFNEQRYASTNSFTGGLSINTDVVFIVYPLPAFTPWPNIEESEQILKVMTTNKIIHCTGILNSTTSFDGEAKKTATNLMYDAVSGRPLLTKATNEFGDDIFSYSIPAHWYYRGMGPAYLNEGIEFSYADINTSSIASVTGLSNTYSFTFNTGNKTADYLIPGDELLLSHEDASGTKTYCKGYIQRVDAINKAVVLYTKVPFSIATSSGCVLSAKVIRSGRKNHLTVDAGNITAMKNPITNRTLSYCTVDPGYVPTHTYTCTDNLRLLIDILNYPIFYVDGHLRSGMSYDFTDISTGAIYHLNLAQDEFILTCVSGGETHEVRFRIKDGTSLLTFYYISGIRNPTVTFDSYGVPTFHVDVKIGASSTYYTPCTLESTYDGHSLSEACGNMFGANEDILMTECQGMKYYVLNDVLNASAVMFKDGWSSDFGTVCKTKWYSTGTSTPLQEFSSLSISNPFGVGEKGIWRPEKTYTYVDTRNQNTPNMKLSKDGTFDNMPMFVWTNPLYFECDATKKWRKVNTITQYSTQNFETENKNILGIYSSALYGYSDKVPIAVASNAGKREIGYEGFEEYTEGETFSIWNNSTGNLDFVTTYDNPPFIVYNAYDILWAQGNQVIIDKPFDASDDLMPGDINLKIEAFCGKDEVNAYPNEDLLCYGTESSATANPGSVATYGGKHYDGKTLITLSSGQPGFSYENDTRCWRGKVYVPRPRSYEGSLGGFSYTDEKAHTGTMSLKVTGFATTESTAGNSFMSDAPQLKLDLVPNKKYVFSAWVSKASTDLPTYAGSTAPKALITFYDKSHVIIGTAVEVSTIGEIIEGWQKVEGTVTAPTGTYTVSIQLGAQGGYGNTTYWDDIRIFPFDGNMQTYVYDRSNYKLRAVLDNNNYATFYSYDEQGNLFLLKKETHEGIITIQESRAHIKE